MNIIKFKDMLLDSNYRIYVVDSIQNADKRINFVSLMEPELTTYVLKPQDIEPKPLLSSDNQSAYIKLLASNILNGNVSLFDYDTRFNYDLGQKKCTDSMVNTKVKKIVPNLSLTLTNNTLSNITQVVGFASKSSCMFGFNVKNKVLGERIWHKKVKKKIRLN